MGGSSGGSSGSGKVSYATYMQDAHEDWLDNAGTDTMTSSIVDLMETAHGSSPFAGITATDPDADITAYEAAVAAFSAFVLAVDPETNWETYIGSATTEIDDNILDDTTLLAEIAANDAIVDSRITTTILPRFQAGMRDINAVVSSAFVIGQSNIESEAQLDKNKFAADLRLQNYRQRNDMIMAGTKDILNLLIQKLEYYKIANHYIIESKRIKNVMLTEEIDKNVHFDEKDTVWDMSVYQYGGNVMAAIHGGAASTTGNQPSVASKALGGALSGAAAGAVASGGNPVGAGIGAAIGVAGSIL